MAVTTVEFDDPLPKLRPTERRPALAGFGAQFNTNLFAADGKGEDEPLTAAERAALLATIKDLRLGHSRIFVRPVARNAGRQRTALMDTIELAHDAGANVNLTWWTGPYPHEPQPDHEQKRKALMDGFAGIIKDTRTATRACVTHVTIQNEVNSYDIAKQLQSRKSMELYNLLYRDLHDSLSRITDPLDSTKTLRDAVDLVGGDLVEAGPGSVRVAGVKHPYAHSDQSDWLAFMRDRMVDVLDGYSIHVYWQPDEFPDRPTKRLKDLAALGIKKPIYITEYGVRWLAAKPRPGTFAKSQTGTPMEEAIGTAFQHAWFSAMTPQYGCVGLTKWVLYRTTKSGDFGNWGMVGPRAKPRPFRPTPLCTITRIFNDLIGPGWTADGLGNNVGPSMLASKFKGLGGDQSIVVLNNGANAQQLQVGFLKKNARLSVVDWNADRQGTRRALAAPASSGSSGVVTVTVPPRGLVAVTTRALN